MTRDQIQAQLADALREKYEILRWIGGGGMAEVFLARHRIHGALFAVKVLSVDLAQDERIVARFVQEARTAANLAGHPNIVPIFDIGEQNGLYFLIMQYVDGEDLSKYLKRNKKLAPKEAARIICQVADALVWASAKGVVHRDLKPSNLYLDQNGRVMVLDFGIAKAADVPSPLTVATERLGTTYYMSPEQIRGEPCDVRSDLYSLGVVFFELLAGRKPFDGDSYRSIEIAHIETLPPDLRQLDPALPTELASAVKILLAKNPGDRYQSPRELVDDLNRYGSGSTAQVKMPPAPNFSSEETLVRDVSPTPAPLPARKAPSNAFLISAIAILAVLVLAAAWYLIFVRERAPRTAADANLTSPAGVARPTSTLPAVKVDRLGGRMHLIPAGKFIFGNDSDPHSPNGQETVNLPAFYIDETEVSNASYRKFCDQTGHKPPDSDTFATQPDFPVANVSFEDAAAYAAWIGKRLPNEREWEKAARGENGRIYPWGNQPWMNPPTSLQSVVSFPDRVSPYGSYNMAGNVAEWTTSHYPVGDAEIRDMTKSLGTSHFSHDWRVIKGGYFGPNHDVNEAWKTYMRRGFPKDIAVSPYIGFRCIEDAK
ncbi:MAG TPA: bifunctional serine/threonine-protein kinase/formylglycine-generating enzyme family protein [Bryobacteraceae bacterium]|nr:bifunctional serine/threonine-protein kinase/formylglycine-generating enzyme family protein [Bryobacteraceae bacterium]